MKEPVGVIIELETGKEYSRFYHPDNAPVSHAVFSLNERYVLITFQTQLQQFWQTDGSKCLSTIDNEKSYFSDERSNKQDCIIPVVNNGILLPGMGYDTSKVIYLRNMKTGEKLLEYTGNDYSVNVIKVTQDNDRFLTLTKEGVVVNGNINKAILIFDFTSGKILNRIPNERRGVFESCSFGGDMDEYVITSNDFSGVLTIWYLGTQEKPNETAVKVHRLIGHNSPSVYLSPSISTGCLISASIDNSIKLWDWQKQLKACHKIIKECPNMEKLAQKMEITHDKPYKSGEGTIETLSMAVSK